MKLTYHPIRLLIALLLTGAVLATACGDDSDADAAGGASTTAATTSDPSRRAFPAP